MTEATAIARRMMPTMHHIAAPPLLTSSPP